MMKARDIAIHFIDYVSQHEEYGELISNLKLQKLLYYAQGLHLAILNEPLFGDDIELWQHGPVVKEVYNLFKKYGNGHIPSPQVKVVCKPETAQFLADVYDVYGSYSSWALCEITRQEQPCLETLQNHVISRETLQTYFLTQIVEDDIWTEQS